MKHIILPQVSWTTGTILIAVFAIVCLILIGAVLALVMSGKKKKD